MRRFITITLCIFIVFLIEPQKGLAQKFNTQADTVFVSQQERLTAPHLTAFSLLNYSSFNTRSYDFAFNEVPYASSKYNFRPPFLKYAGDVTGNGRDNLYFNVETHDPDSEDPGGTMYKTFLYDSNFFFEDEVYYVPANLTPVGDMTGNGHTDAIEATETLVFYEGGPNGYTRFGEFSTESFNSSMFIVTDLNQNGFDDLVFHRGYRDTAIFFGAENPADIEFSVYTHPQEFGNTRGLIPVEVEGNNYLIAHTYSGNTTHFLFGKMNDNDELEFSETGHTQDEQISGLQVVNKEGSGLPKFFYYRVFIGTTEMVESISFEGGILTLEETSTTVFVPPIYNVNNVGDVTGNGFDDFCYIGAGGTQLGVGQEDLTTGFETSYVLEKDGVGLQCRSNSYRKSLNLFGDGQRYFLTIFSDIDQLGQVFVTVEDGSLAFESMIYSTEDFIADQVIATVTLGDINGNGYDDYAIIRETSRSVSEIDVYYGGFSFSETPDYTITGPEGSYTNKLIALDYTGNGQKELFVPWRFYENSSNYTVSFSFYSSSNLSADPLHSFSLDDISDYSFVWQKESINISSKGDVTGNGLDDILIGTPNVGDEQGISIPNSTVYLLEGASDFVPNVYTFEGGGAMVAVLGDINGNGLSDMLMNTPIDNPNEAYIFYGSDSFETGTLYQPDDTLTLELPLSTHFFLGVGGPAVGDFTGNGFTDIALSTYNHAASGDGGEAVFIFEGNSEGISLTPDRSLKLLVDAYHNPGFLPADGSYLESSLGTIASMPDITGNGADELIYASYSIYELNAGIYYGGNNFGSSDEPDILLLSPNPYRGIGPNSNNLNGHGVIATGRFTGQDGADIILPHFEDYRFPSNGAYAFSIPFSPVSIGNEPEGLPAQITLHQNYPNPFNPTTAISFSLPDAGDVKLDVFDMQGRMVANLVNSQMAAGTHNVTFDASRLASGLYLYRLTSGSTVQTQKMMLIK